YGGCDLVDAQVPRPNAQLLHNVDGDVRGVRNRVVDGRALLRLRDERLDVLLRRVGVDLERHLDAVVAVADVGVHAEDPLDVHGAFDVRLDGTELDAAVLRDGGDARREAARQA